VRKVTSREKRNSYNRTWKEKKGKRGVPDHKLKDKGERREREPFPIFPPRLKPVIKKGGCKNSDISSPGEKQNDELWGVKKGSGEGA